MRGTFSSQTSQYRVGNDLLARLGLDFLALGSSHTPLRLVHGCGVDSIGDTVLHLGPDVRHVPVSGFSHFFDNKEE